MTDQERASAWLTRLYDLNTEDLAAELAAVRLDERRPIVAFLRGRPMLARHRAGPSTVAAVAVLETAAERIERGEHGS